MRSKIVSQLDENGYFVCPAIADESPLEPGVWLIPGGAVDATPPELGPNQRAKWNGSKFVIEVVKKEEPTLLSIDERRLMMRTQIDIKRDQLRYSGIRFNGAVFSTDSFARQQYQLIVTTDTSVEWKTLDKQSFILDKPTATDLLVAIINQDDANFRTAAEHKKNLDDGANPDLYNWGTGWYGPLEGNQ